MLPTPELDHIARERALLHCYERCSDAVSITLRKSFEISLRLPLDDHVPSHRAVPRASRTRRARLPLAPGRLLRVRPIGVPRRGCGGWRRRRTAGRQRAVVQTGRVSPDGIRGQLLRALPAVASVVIVFLGRVDTRIPVS